MRIILGVASVMLLIIIGYYLFFVPYEFEVRFSVKTTPGDVIQTLRVWNRSQSTMNVKVDTFQRAEQRMTVNGHSYILNWIFDDEDSLTKVIVRLTEPNRRLLNKIQVLVGEPPIELDGAIKLKEFHGVLLHHLEITSVQVVGEVKKEGEFCLCRTIEKDQMDKAQGMMENYMILSSFLETTKLEMSGMPSVRVNNWSHIKGRLSFDFCFPIVRPSILPEADGFVYKNYDQIIALKAVYNGNYITSDRAWYVLYQYLKNQKYKAVGYPVEVFFDNPNFGTNESEWRAEIFLPIVK